MAGASLLLSPSLLKASSDSEIWEMTNKNGGVMLKSDGLKITGTFWMKFLMIFLIRIGG